MLYNCVDYNQISLFFAEGCQRWPVAHTWRLDTWTTGISFIPSTCFVMEQLCPECLEPKVFHSSLSTSAMFVIISGAICVNWDKERSIVCLVWTLGHWPLCPGVKKRRSPCSVIVEGVKRVRAQKKCALHSPYLGDKAGLQKKKKKKQQNVAVKRTRRTLTISGVSNDI